MLVDPAQIDDRLDSALGQRLETVIGGLAASSDVLVKPLKVGQTRGVLAGERSGKADGG